MTRLIKVHGPFDPVSKAKRSDVREDIRRRVKGRTCRCELCEERIAAGKDPQGWPDDHCWVRQSSRDNGVQPVGQRPVYLCSVVRNDSDMGAH